MTNESFLQEDRVQVRVDANLPTEQKLSDCVRNFRTGSLPKSDFLCPLKHKKFMC